MFCICVVQSLKEDIKCLLSGACAEEKKGKQAQKLQETQRAFGWSSGGLLRNS